MDPYLEHLRKCYSQLSDDRLILFAAEKARDLRPEVAEVFRQVLRKRNISEDILRGIDVQRQPLPPFDFMECVELIRGLPCPICHSKQHKLNATWTAMAASVIAESFYSSKFKIACPACLNKEHYKSIAVSVLAGWWGFPMGPIYTIKALALNLRMRRGNRVSGPNDLIRAFVLENLGWIEAYKNDATVLQAKIRNIG